MFPAPVRGWIENENLALNRGVGASVLENWFPEADHAFAYALVGPGGTIDTQKLIYSGPLQKTGVQAEIRSGGPAIGFQQISSILYQDDSILLGMVGNDEAIQLSKDQPTIAVFSSYEKRPQIWMWGNPAWDFKSTADIAAAGVKVLAFDGATYLDVFVQKGLLKKDQIDTSYKGDPARFVAEDGSVAQQGFVTNEPYLYEHEVKAWDKPVKFVVPNKPGKSSCKIEIVTDKGDQQTITLPVVAGVTGSSREEFVFDHLRIEYPDRPEADLKEAARGALLDYEVW